MLPPPARILLGALMTWNPPSSSPLGGGIVVAPVLAAQAHALAFHAPAMWSARVHRQSCLQLTEHILYYGLLQIGVIAVLAYWNLGSPHMNACYCGIYYAWDIGKHALAAPSGTLSAWGLVGSLVAYALVTLPYYHHHYGQPAYTTNNDSAAGDAHLLAWTVADACCYVTSWLIVGSQDRRLYHMLTTPHRQMI